MRVKVFSNIDVFNPVKDPVVTVGTFDGVHIGHQGIIRRMKELAKQNDTETIIITFDPHPRMVIHPDSWDLKLINAPKRKIDLIGKTGIDNLIVIPFTKEFAEMSSFDFIKEILVKKLGVKKMIVGYDHHFGKDRLGNFNSLQEVGEELGFDVEEVPAQFVDGVAVSSSMIRKALNDGDISIANRLLGYEYSIYGKVVEGYKIGKSIGFPTANIEVDDKLKLITANGVYACKIMWKGKRFIGMGNIGVRPTLNRKDLTIEVNIFDFDEEIYGDYLTVYWIDRIRDEIKFENLDALKQQLIKDKQTTLKILGKE